MSRDVFPGRLVTVMVVSLLGLALTTACEPLDELAAPAPVASDADLDSLTVADWAAMTGYKRDKFGDGWQSQGSGCDTRDVVLQRDGEGVVTAAPCKITTGTWFSVYDGESLTDPGDVDIDHMVPLANAWRTGAASWTDEQRKAFANDLERPQLLAVSMSSNRSKGDQDPSQWKPPRRESWCSYARSWITVKSYWGLSVTADEKTALAQMLGTCA